MPSKFLAALARAEPEMDRHLAEDVSIIPMRGGDFSALPDGTRPVVDCVALVTEPDGSAAQIAKMDLQIVYEETTVEVRRALLPVDYRPRKGDEIVLLERPGSPRLIVTRIERDDPERVALVCGPRSAD